jgi:hypothetical protein
MNPGRGLCLHDGYMDPCRTVVGLNRWMPTRPVPASHGRVVDPTKKRHRIGGYFAVYFVELCACAAFSFSGISGDHVSIARGRSLHAPASHCVSAESADTTVSPTSPPAVRTARLDATIALLFMADISVLPRSGSRRRLSLGAPFSISVSTRTRP